MPFSRNRRTASGETLVMPAAKPGFVPIRQCLQTRFDPEFHALQDDLLTDLRPGQDENGGRPIRNTVPQDIALYPDLSARENLEFWGKMYSPRGTVSRQRVDEVLEIIGLTERQKDRVGKFSGGMKRRVNIGVALLHKPAVVIMDEPTVGIDPQSRRHILDNVKQLNDEGMTVLYTTLYMEEAAELSNHISIMHAGKIIAGGTHAELIRLVGEQTRLEMKLSAPGETVLENWRRVDGVSRASAQNGEVTVLAQDSNVVLPRLVESAARLGVRITAVDIQEPNLESVFLQLTGKALRD
jgi:ABC-2 type transport system ATP-binding protein